MKFFEKGVGLGKVILEKDWDKRLEKNPVSCCNLTNKAYYKENE